jgi:hypothetical protein
LTFRPVPDNILTPLIKGSYPKSVIAVEVP